MLGYQVSHLNFVHFNEYDIKVLKFKLKGNIERFGKEIHVFMFTIDRGNKNITVYSRKILT